jgi:hypothetical protein
LHPPHPLYSGARRLAIKSVFLFRVRPRQRQRCVGHFFAASLLRPFTSDCVGVRALKANQRVRFKVNSKSQSLRTMPMRHCKPLSIFFNPFALEEATRNGRLSQ